MQQVESSQAQSRRTRRTARRFGVLPVGERGTKMTGYVIVDAATSRLVDGYYFEEAMARNIAKRYDRYPDEAPSTIVRFDADGVLYFHNAD